MKNKTIIALQGDADTGKSITIGLLFEMMKHNGFEVIQDKKQKNSKDFFVILKKNEILIGVSSYGDTEYFIKERCGRFVDAGCEIIVCACHQKGKTVSAVHSFVGYTPAFVPKTVAPPLQQQNSNNADANVILNMVIDLIE